MKQPHENPNPALVSLAKADLTKLILSSTNRRTASSTKFNVRGRNTFIPRKLTNDINQLPTPHQIGEQLRYQLNRFNMWGPEPDNSNIQLRNLSRAVQRIMAEYSWTNRVSDTIHGLPLTQLVRDVVRKLNSLDNSLTHELRDINTFTNASDKSRGHRLRFSLKHLRDQYQQVIAATRNCKDMLNQGLKLVKEIQEYQTKKD